MGPKTQQALRAFQKENGLAGGRLDDKTVSALGVDTSDSGKGGSSSASGKSESKSSSSSGSSGTSSGSGSARDPFPIRPSAKTGQSGPEEEPPSRR